MQSSESAAYTSMEHGRRHPTEALKTARRKFERGDSITDRELDMLIELFEQLELGLRAMGVRFDLARVEVYRNLLRAEDYRANRQKKVSRKG